jgi:hypothetical protein
MKKTISFSVDAETYAEIASIATRNHRGTVSEFARIATIRVMGQYKGRPPKNKVQEVLLNHESRASVEGDETV